MVAGNGDRRRGPCAERRGEESGMDRDIRAAVHEALVTDPRIDADGIVVEVFDGAITLNGTVPSQAQRSEAAAASSAAAR